MIVFAFWNVLVTGQRSFFVYPDNVAQAYPWYQKLASSLHRGYLPLWDANVNSGNSFVGENQTGVFYPLNLIVMTLFGTRSGVPIRALESLTVLHFFIAAWGMYLFCRRLRCSRGGSFYAGIVFSLLGPHANRAMAQTMIFYTYSLLPFAAYFALCFLQTKRYRYAAAAGVVVGLSITAGHFAAPFMTCLVCAAILINGLRADDLTRLATGSAIFVIILIAAASPQIIFGILHFTTSYRIVGTPMPQLATAKIPLAAIQQFALNPSSLLSLFNPVKFSGGIDGNGLFLGVMPLVAITLLLSDSSTRSKLRQSLRECGGLFALAGLAIVLSLGLWTPVGQLWYLLPGFATVVREPGRYILIAQFVFAIVLGLAVDGFMRDYRSEFDRRLLAAVGIFAVIGYGTYVTVALPNPTAALWLLAIAIVAFTAVKFAGLPARFATFTLVATGTLEAILAASQLPQPVTAATYAPTMYRDRPAYHIAEACFSKCRVSFEGAEGLVPANIGDVYPLQSDWGYTALIDRDYLDFDKSDPGDPEFVLDLLNVRYIISSTTRPPPIRLVSADETEGLYVYERPSYFPRVFSLDAALRHNRARNDVAFSVSTYNDVHQKFVVTTPRDEIVVFSELYYPGWNVKVDAHAVQMAVAGIRVGPPIFRAVFLQSGKHVVDFKYL